MSGVIHASEVKVGVLPSADPVEHLDEDWAVPCQTEQHEEPPQANWVMWMACVCKPGFALICTGCKDAALSNRQPLVVCDYCEMVFIPALAAIRLIEPLNRRTT